MVAARSDDDRALPADGTGAAGPHEDGPAGQPLPQAQDRAVAADKAPKATADKTPPAAPGTAPKATADKTAPATADKTSPATTTTPAADKTPAPAAEKTLAAAADKAPTPAGSDARTMRARRLLEEAIERAEKAKTGEHRRGVRVDKYFGSKLPPVCARLGCYVTDDGKRFYCINPACQKHKRRETKHTRLGQPVKEQVVYFKCPRCDSRTIEMHLLANRYLCRTCRYNWER